MLLGVGHESILIGQWCDRHHGNFTVTVVYLFGLLFERERCNSKHIRGRSSATRSSYLIVDFASNSHDFGRYLQFVCEWQNEQLHAVSRLLSTRSCRTANTQKFSLPAHSIDYANCWNHRISTYACQPARHWQWYSNSVAISPAITSRIGRSIWSKFSRNSPRIPTSTALRKIANSNALILEIFCVISRQVVLHPIYSNKKWIFCFKDCVPQDRIRRRYTVCFTFRKILFRRCT